MTRVALQGRRFVERYRISCNQFSKGVTFFAFYSGVAALQRQFRSLVVVKCRRHPALYAVTSFTRRFSSAIFELLAMRFRVARFTFFRGPFELNLFHSPGNFVARAAGYGSMRSD